MKAFLTFLLFFMFLFSAPVSALADAIPAYAPWLHQGQADTRGLVTHHQHMNAERMNQPANGAPIYSSPFASYVVPQVPGSQLGQPILQPTFQQMGRPLVPISIPQEKPEAEPSPLEKMYARRIVENLAQFGYDMFGVPTQHTAQALYQAPAIPYGAVGDDFILSIGDQVEIVFTGQRQDRDLYTINNQGLVILKDFPPIPAAGRSIGQLRLSIQAAAQNLHNTRAFVSLGSVRQISILVVGHVKRPGRKNMTAFNSVLDALMEAGGIEKTGSLRQVKLVRDGRSTYVDLYALLLHGGVNVDLNLQNGDRIIVPPLGPTVAIAGEVKRPGIFEILPRLKGMRHKPAERSERLSLNDMLELSGGVLAPGQNRFLKLDVSEKGQERVEENSDPFRPVFGDGAILMVSKGSERRAGSIELVGNTRKPGIYALGSTKSLSALLSGDEVLGDNIYPLIGVIERWDEDQLATKMIDFPVRLVLSGDYDRQLNDGDVIHLFDYDQMKELEKEPADTPIEQGSLPPELEDEDAFQISDPSLRSFLKERSVFLRGAVRKPGLYPVSEGLSLETLLAVAGGLSLEASLSNLEITSSTLGGDLKGKSPTGTVRHIFNLRETLPEEIILEAGDAVRVNRKFKRIQDKSVVIMGEVRNPGRYDLLPGDKMSDLIDRAGGMTRESYPDGAIFSRKAERMAEEKRYKSQALELKRSLAAAQEEDEINAAQLSEARMLIAELENAQGIGRITVEADPAVLETDPALDMLLQEGDRVYIPKRSLTVRVSGEVLSSAALQFREGKKPRDYINEAGGFTFHADKDRTFVVYPDGSAQPLQVSNWNYTPVFIPPGSTIIVPRDPKPFDFIESAKDVSQILSNLALTTLFIDDVREDD